MRSFKITVAAAAALALAVPAAYGLGISAKAKGTKVQGNLVQAYEPASCTTPPCSGTGDDERDDPALTDPAVQRGACTFESGKFKAQVGKDASVKLKGVNCGGTPYDGQLCAHTKALTTIMDEELDKEGNWVADKTCTSTGGDIQGQMNFSTGNIGLLTCTGGKCEGTLPSVVADPCPSVDKISELKNVEVFDGPYKASITVLGTPLEACCGPNQTVVGPFGVGSFSPCKPGDPGENQDVMGEMGTVLQGLE